MAFGIALLGQLWSETVACLGAFGGGAKGGEDGDVFDDVGRLFVEEALFLFSEADAFAVEVLELVDFFDRGAWVRFLDMTLEGIHGKIKVFIDISHLSISIGQCTPLHVS